MAEDSELAKKHIIGQLRRNLFGETYDGLEAYQLDQWLPISSFLQKSPVSISARISVSHNLAKPLEVPLNLTDERLYRAKEARYNIIVGDYAFCGK